MKVVQIVLLLLVLALSGPAPGAESEALIAKCESCHGAQGISPHSDIPVIAGQTPEYLHKTLRNFQRWDRPCIKTTWRSGDTSRPKTDMCQIVAGLTNEEMDMLSTHFSALEFVAVKQEFDETLAAAGAVLHEQHCESCHQQGGSMAGRGPRLAGQWMPYLKTSLKYVPTGEHLVPPRMEKEIAKFSEEDKARLLNFFASQQN